MKKQMDKIRVGIITVSDRAFNHEREDQSGPALIAFCQKLDWQVTHTDLINDDFEKIKEMLHQFCTFDDLDLVLTTGGTGVSPTDRTPDATLAIIHKQIPGISERMRLVGFEKNPNALLSRAVAGILLGKLIINLPGNPIGAVESLQSVHQVIPHAILLMVGFQPHE
jgi:molybdenum cofactor synthesis domain-containing protein